jgi:hypothetical protein
MSVYEPEVLEVVNAPPTKDIEVCTPLSGAISFPFRSYVKANDTFFAGALYALEFVLTPSRPIIKIKTITEVMACFMFNCIFLFFR